VGLELGEARRPLLRVDVEFKDLARTRLAQEQTNLSRAKTKGFSDHLKDGRIRFAIDCRLLDSNCQASCGHTSNG